MKESVSGGPDHSPRDGLRYVVIEGVIGVGKTTLASMLAERLRAQIVLEEFEQNPFLERFYEDPTRWAFQTQLSFLTSRFRQQKELDEQLLFHHAIVSDYSFDKDRIFAHVNLNGDELELYETLYRQMEPVTPVPDLVVYLRSNVDKLMQNIVQRGRPYEKNMDPKYIRMLCEAYDRYFRAYNRSVLLVIDAAPIDFVQNEKELNELVSRITAAKRHGTTHHTPDSNTAPAPF